ncbi:uncharacterized protein [Ptychodera flava]|uniref:uncharacterized protein isoform X2 n=1 Tax=Ptychodera flava TaxID=63121 RepID=UPI003969F95F
MANSVRLIYVLAICLALCHFVKCEASTYNDEPPDISVEVVTLFKVRLTWDDPLASLATGPVVYTIEYQPVNPTSTSQGAKYQEVVDSQEVTITNGIGSFTRYRFRLRKGDDTGYGPYGEPVYATTSVIGGRDAPILKPLVVKVEEVGRSESGVDVTVTFRSVSAQGFEHTGNLVFYSDDPTSTDHLSWPLVRLDNTENESPLITGLQPGARYVFVVQNFNMRGAGPLSERMYYDVHGGPEEADELPGPPTRAPSGLSVSAGREEGSVKVRFELINTVPDEDGRGGYTVFYYEHPSGDDRTYLTIAGTFDFPIYIHYLKAGSQYAFSVRGTNQYGLGPFSDIVLCTVPLQPPGPPTRAPTGLSVSAGSEEGSVEVRFELINTLPDEDGRGGYTVYYHEHPSGDDRNSRLILGTFDFPIYIHNLKAGSQYAFSVRARNQYGFGPYSDVVLYTVPLRPREPTRYGLCPNMENYRGCVDECQRAFDCPAGQICCFNGCGRNCVTPTAPQLPEPIQQWTCTQLEPPANGNVNCSNGNNVDLECYYTCDVGFELKGSISRTCDDKQQWSGTEPLCITETTYAGCYIFPNPAMSPSLRSYLPIQGRLSVSQRAADDPIVINLDLIGFTPNTTHGFHVHQYGYIDSQRGCSATGGHYNPHDKVHGSPEDEERHVGDLGNIVSDGDGKIQLSMTDNVASLLGPNSIIGRSFVIHAGVDDLGQGGDQGSLTTGNAGARLGCCVIGRVPKPEE